MTNPLPLEILRMGVVDFYERVRDTPWGGGSITAVHWHHTYRPNHADFAAQGGEKLVRAMYRFHTATRGWRHMGQHVTIDADGWVWLGRPWALAPASAVGNNGRDFGPRPFMFEMIGDFRNGKDALTGAQLDAALLVTAIIQRRFGLSPAALMFHKHMQPTECPGDLDKDRMVEGVRAMHGVLEDNMIAAEETYAPLRSAPGIA